MTTGGSSVLERDAVALFKGLLRHTIALALTTPVLASATGRVWPVGATCLALGVVGVALHSVVERWPAWRVASIYAGSVLTLSLVLGAAGDRAEALLTAAMLIGAGSFLYGTRGAALTLVGGLASLVLATLAAGTNTVWDWLAPGCGFVLAAATGRFMHLVIESATKRLEAQQHALQRSAAVLETEVKLRKHAQTELARNYESALEGARVKTAFLANMSHELRTPMNAVVGLTDLLLRDELTKSQRENLETVRESSEGLLVLLDDLLDLSKIEAGAMRLDSVDFAPRDVVAQLERLLTPRAQARGLALELTCDEGVPAALKGDPLRLNQVLTNLVGNSLKFTEKGRVGAVLRWEAGTLVAEITDTGIGMTVEQQNNLFQPFTQADATMTRRFGGTGLGLAIVKRLCELHEGDATVKSELGVGSTFTARLKYAIGEAPRKRTRSTRKVVEPLVGFKVLIAEDNVINQRVAERLLERLGVEYAVAHNGLEAVAEVKQGTWEVVLMDLQMPEMDGLEATRQIRGLPGMQPVIIGLSANAMMEDRAAASAAGVDDFLPKPITLDVLADALHRARTRGLGSSRS